MTCDIQHMTLDTHDIIYNILPKNELILTNTQLKQCRVKVAQTWAILPQITFPFLLRVNQVKLSKILFTLT